MKLLAVLAVLSLIALCSSQSTSYNVYYNRSLASDITYGKVEKTARNCWITCTKTTNCGASAWIKSWGGCYLMSTQRAKDTMKIEAGTILYTAGSTPLTYTPGNCKRGVGYGFQNVADIAAFTNIKWWYNWYYSPTPVKSEDYSPLSEFVPMVWGPNFVKVDTVKSALQPYVKYLLGFNEPNFVDQANMTPDKAAELWPQLEQIAASRNLELVSPAINYCGGSCVETNPFKWLNDFFTACDTRYPGKGCKVNFIAAHWYSCDALYLAQYIEDLRQFASRTGKTSGYIWLTEFDCPDASSTTVQDAYMRSALDLLDNEPAVFRYAWFAARANNVQNANLLQSSSSGLTSLGATYNTYNIDTSGNTQCSFAMPSSSTLKPAPTPKSPTSTPTPKPVPTPKTPTPVPVASSAYTKLVGKTILGNNLAGSDVTTSTPEDCWALCAKTSGCVAGTWVNSYYQRCYLKDAATVKSSGISSDAAIITVISNSVYVAQAQADVDQTYDANRSNNELPSLAYLGIGIGSGVGVVLVVVGIALAIKGRSSGTSEERA